MLADTKQVKFDVVAFVGELPYMEVRAEELRAPAQCGYAAPFLYHLQSRLIEGVEERLKASGDETTREMVDALVMLLMLNGKVEIGTLTGLDAETLTSVVEKSTRLMEW